MGPAVLAEQRMRPARRRIHDLHGTVLTHRMWYPLLVEGTPFGRYRLLELLGAGAMGEVHRAYDTGTDRMVALKVLAPEYIHDTVYRTRFQREAHAAARLSEPHIVPIHDYGEIDGRLFLDMRLVEAPNLASVLAEQERLTPDHAVEVITQIAAALAAAHAEGLVHRDVKPSNILRTPEGFAYLIDFGISRSDQDTTLTTTGVMVGTFAYMAPERLSQDDSDARADVYSLACVLYECLSGVKPYRGESVHRQIAGHLNEQPPLPSEAGVPTPFDAVIAKGMAKDPDARYASTTALAAAAHAALRAPDTPPDEQDAPTADTAPASGVRTAAPAGAPPAPDVPGARRGTPAADSPNPPPWRAASAAAVLVLGAACVTGVVMLTGDNTPVGTDAPAAPASTGGAAETTPPSDVAHTPAEPAILPPPPDPVPPWSEEPVQVVPSAPGQQPHPAPDPPTTTTPVTTTAETPTPTSTPTPTPTETSTTETTTIEPTATETTTTETSTAETTTTTTSTGDNNAGGGDDMNATGSTIATTPDSDPTAIDSPSPAPDSASPTPADTPAPPTTGYAAPTTTGSAAPATTGSAAPPAAG